MFAIDNYRKVRESYLECIKPYVKIKSDIYAITIPLITISEDGEISHEYVFTDQQNLIFKQLEEIMDIVKRDHEKMAKDIAPSQFSYSCKSDRESKS